MGGEKMKRSKETTATFGKKLPVTFYLSFTALIICSFLMSIIRGEKMKLSEENERFLSV